MSKKKRNAVPDLPDLEPIEDELHDARALANVAYLVVVEGHDAQGESSVLRITLATLDRALDQLDDVADQLRRLRKEVP